MTRPPFLCFQEKPNRKVQMKYTDTAFSTDQSNTYLIRASANSRFLFVYRSHIVCKKVTVLEVDLAQMVNGNEDVVKYFRKSRNNY